MRMRQKEAEGCVGDGVWPVGLRRIRHTSVMRLMKAARTCKGMNAARVDGEKGRTCAFRRTKTRFGERVRGLMDGTACHSNEERAHPSAMPLVNANDTLFVSSRALYQVD